jgi:hypothetical protein
MSVDQARRGRPRGSGLDDRAHLRAVIQKLEADPALKPTTAIKAIGISDPSTIRRLREKLRSARAPETSEDIGREVERSTFGRVQACIDAGSEARHTEPAAMPSREASRAATENCDRGLRVSPQRRQEDQFSWLAQWCGLSLHAISTAVEVQMAAIESLLRVPHVASALRQQVLLNERVMAFCVAKPDVRKTLH